jgi:hypothetical protein
VGAAVKSLREQKAEARRLGIIVTPVRRHGEVRFMLPNGGPSVRVNNRRTDGTRAVQRFIDKHKEKPP